MRAKRPRWVADAWYWWETARLAGRVVAERWSPFSGERWTGRGGGGVVEAIMRDTQVAVRRMVRSPGFTGLALLSLALGIGVNTALFSVVNEALLEPPPFEEVDALFNVYANPGDTDELRPLSFPDYRDLEGRTTGVFSAVSTGQVEMVQPPAGAQTTAIMVEFVTGNYFELLGVEAARGRLFQPEEGRNPGEDPLVVLSHGYWQRAFAGDPDVVGSTVRISGSPLTVVGIAPEWYRGALKGLEPELYLPISMMVRLSSGGRTDWESRREAQFLTRARLAPGVTPAEARARVEAVALELAREHPETNARLTFRLLPTSDVAVLPGVDRVVVPTAVMLSIVVGLVLLITCANLASFLLARAEGRRKDAALRLALGSGRGALIRSLLTETMLLALLGGLAGIVLSAGLVRLMVGVDLPFPVPVTLHPELDHRVLAFAVAITVGAGLLFGLGPALRTSRLAVASTLREVGGRSKATGLGRVSIRDALVVVQVAVSVVLLVSAGLFLRSLQSSQRMDPGFGYDPAALVWMALPPERYSTSEEIRVFTESLRERVAQLPGLGPVGLTHNMHLRGTGSSSREIDVPGVEPPPGKPHHEIDYARVDPSFFDVMGIPIVAGRGFGPEDNPDGAPVAIVSEAFARRFWPGRSALGRVLTAGGHEVTVVGVARDTDVRSFGEVPRTFLYVPWAQEPSRSFMVVATTEGPADPVVPEVARIALEVEPLAMVFSTSTMEQHLAYVTLPARISAVLLTLMGGLALTLAAVGLYGVVSYAVASRTRELGIRMAMGAKAQTVVSMVLRRGLGMVGVGIVIGLPLAFLSSRLLRGMLYGVGPTDPTTYVAVSALLLGVAALACWLPARRASRIDPVTALRTE